MALESRWRPREPRVTFRDAALPAMETGGSMRRHTPRLGLLVAATALGCGLLPERMVFNGPPGMLRQLLFGSSIGAPAASLQDSRLRVPPGFSLTLFADDLPDARMLRFGATGDLLVSQPRSGQITRLEPDRDRDGRSDGRSVVVAGLDRPHGIDFLGDWLYIAESDAFGRIAFDPATGRARGAFERLVTGIPGGGNHWSRTLRVGPDGWIYLTVGSSCNVCEEDDPRRAALLRYRPDGSGEEIFATGLRNTVGIDWQAGTGALFGTDNGRDLLGNDFPPCELNRIEAGGFYGWPRVNGFGVVDPDLGEGHDAEIARARSPVHGFRAHNAPLGITFLRSDSQPPEWRGRALVALHGSWNRTVKDGYRVVSLAWRGDGAIVEEPFLTGFLELGGSANGAREADSGAEVIGRPVDVAEAADGSIYVSDDYAGVVYRVARGTAPAVARARAGAAPASETATPLAGFSAEERDRLATRGAALFETHACFRCHDASRLERGATLVPLARLAARYDVPGLVRFLAAPTPPMPLAPLSDEERRALSVHLLATRSN
jgi:glucose/arabinose dehydrogenase